MTFLLDVLLAHIVLVVLWVSIIKDQRSIALWARACLLLVVHIASLSCWFVSKGALQIMEWLPAEPAPTAIRVFLILTWMFLLYLSIFDLVEKRARWVARECFDRIVQQQFSQEPLAMCRIVQEALGGVDGVFR